MADSDLAKLGFLVDTSGLRHGESSLDSYAATGEKAEARMSKSVKSMNSEFMTMRNVIGLASVALAGLGIGRLTAGIKEYSDTWMGLSSQIRQVTDSEADLVATREALFKISQDTRSEIDTTVRLYAELKRSTDDLGLSQAKQLGITKTLNNLFTAGGKPISEVSGAIRQLSQGFASGVLRGDEFNSVAEGAPRIMDALTESLQMTRGELREFAATGGITAEIMVTALEAYSDTAQGMADATERTFGQSIQAAENNALKFVGSSQLINDSLGVLGGTIEDMSENLDSLASAGGAFAVVMTAGLIPATLRYGASLYATTSAQLLAGTAAVRTANAYGVVTVTAASATVATNALTIATRLLMGPWGLLVAAVGIAAATFTTVGNNSDEVTKALSEQKTAADELIKSMNKLSGAELQKAQVDAANKKVELLYEQARLQKEIANYDTTSFIGDDGYGDLGALSGLQDLKNELAAVQEGIKTSSDTLTAAQNQFDKIFEQKTDERTAKIEKESAAWQKWADSVTGFQTPMQKAIEKIELVNEALLSGKLQLTSGVVAYLTAASEELAEFNKSAAENTDFQDWISSIEASTGKIEKLRDEITETYMAIDGGDLSKATGLEYIDQLEDRIASLKGKVEKADIFGGMTDSIKESLGAVQGLSAQGSSEYAKLGVAIQAVTVAQQAQALAASLTMATVTGGISAVLALVGMLDSLGGSLETTFEDNQANQGLNIWGNKSESISKAIDSTADATESLVGINTGMLTALQAMQANISSAAGISALSAGDANFDISSNVNSNPLSGLTGLAMANTFDVLSLGLFSKVFDWIGGALGGSSKTTDSGIQIIGGAMFDLLDGVTVNAFEEIKSKKYAWSSSKTRTYYDQLEEAGDQFTLVFESLADSVFAGATMLGMSSDVATSAINAFEVETQRISLKGLSVEEQQAEIEAVFSTIFDSLAGSVVPFIGEFQATGESLGETLARVANQVAVTEVVIDSLGVKMIDKLADPLLFATISDNLSTMVGGLESFARKTSSLIDDFAPDSVKFEIAFDGITSALDAVGLSLPETSAGFYELMQSLDATTDAGQAQVAALLNSQGLAGDYYDLLDDTVGAFNDTLLSLTSTIESTIDGMFGVTYDAAVGSLDDALTLARAGSFDAAIGLDYGGLSANASDFSSALDFNIAQAKTGNKLSELAALTGSQKTTADLALNESINQTELLASLKKQQEELAVTMVAVQQATIATAEKLQEFQLDSMPVRVVT